MSDSEGKDPLAEARKRLDDIKREAENATPKDSPTKFDIPRLPDASHLDGRISELEATARNIKGRYKTKIENQNERRRVEADDAKGLGQGLQIAYTIIGFPIVSFGVGLIVDSVLKTTYWKGICGLIGCVLAVVIALILINGANKQA